MKRFDYQVTVKRSDGIPVTETEITEALRRALNRRTQREAQRAAKASVRNDITYLQKSGPERHKRVIALESLDILLDERRGVAFG